MVQVHYLNFFVCTVPYVTLRYRTVRYCIVNKSSRIYCSGVDLFRACVFNKIIYSIFLQIFTFFSYFFLFSISNIPYSVILVRRINRRIESTIICFGKPSIFLRRKYVLANSSVSVYLDTCSVSVRSFKSLLQTI